MKKTCLASLALAGLLSSGAANAQFFGTIGYTNVNPDSDNGALAGAGASVSDDWGLPGSLGYRFTPGVFAELSTALVAYEHDISLDGLGTIASVEHRPTILSLNYQFLPESKVRPFVRFGYGWVALSGEQTKGALAGLDISAGSSNGLVYGGGVDFFVAESLFLRANVSMLDFDTDVNVETLDDVGTANVDPLVIGFSIGYLF